MRTPWNLYKDFSSIFIHPTCSIIHTEKYRWISFIGEVQNYSFKSNKNKFSGTSNQEAKKQIVSSKALVVHVIWYLPRRWLHRNRSGRTGTNTGFRPVNGYRAQPRTLNFVVVFHSPDTRFLPKFQILVSSILLLCYWLFSLIRTISFTSWSLRILIFFSPPDSFWVCYRFSTAF